MSTETKRSKRKLRCSSDLELEANSTTPDLGDDVANADLEDDMEGWVDLESVGMFRRRRRMKRMCLPWFIEIVETRLATMFQTKLSRGWLVSRE
jgi:hypothetical protein